jgi:hypothetical protein
MELREQFLGKGSIETVFVKMALGALFRAEGRIEKSVQWLDIFKEQTLEVTDKESIEIAFIDLELANSLFDLKDYLDAYLTSQHGKQVSENAGNHILAQKFHKIMEDCENTDFRIECPPKCE